MDISKLNVRSSLSSRSFNFPSVYLPKSKFHYDLVSSSSRSSNKVELCHQHLGHPSTSVLNLILKDLNVVSNSISLCFCILCQYGKSNHALFLINKNLFPLKIVHSNLWEHLLIVFMDGYIYCIHFINDYSKHTYIYPLQIKFKAKEVFFNSKLLLKNNLIGKSSAYKLIYEENTKVYFHS